MYSYINYNLIFGYGGPDLILYDMCNNDKGDPKNNQSSPQSYSNLGFIYSLPLKNAISNIQNANNEYMTFQSVEARSYLAGSLKFAVNEFEVFTIDFF